MDDWREETYGNLNARSWTEILRRNTVHWTPPKTVHLPIHPPFSPHFVHVDSALNVCRRRMLPGLRVHDPASAERIRALETLLVQFAFDDPPFVPDFNLSTLTLADGRYPVVTGAYGAWDLWVEIQYFCASVEGGQTVLWCVVSVENDSAEPRDAIVWAKVNVQKEVDVFDYHYIPFHWDAGNWLPCKRVSLRDKVICIDGREVGVIRPGAFDCRWVDRQTFDDVAYNRRFGCEYPYFVHAPFRLTQVDNLLRLEAKLNPGERQAFTLALAVDFEGGGEDDVRRLSEVDVDRARAEALEPFRRLPGGECESTAGLVCPVDRLDRMVPALRIGIHQLMVDFKDGAGLVPTQGGTSERFYVWVWEAMFMLTPMLKLGHFALVRQALDFIFSLQDGGCPPSGKLTSTEGAVGTTGPRWLNSTGSALRLAADYYLYSRDAAFLDRFLPRMLRAADWILREIRATRRLNPDGSRPATYGIMPFGCATDADIGHILSMTDGYTHLGWARLVEVLAAIGHPRHAEFRNELTAYRNDVSRAIDTVVREDGFMDRKILTGEEKRIERKFEIIVGAVTYLSTGLLDADDPRWKNFARYFEEHLADHYFTGPMDRDVAYMGASELIWQEAWLRVGEWKKAFMAWQTNLTYGMTPDTFLVQERFSRRNPAFTCWQPNGSGSGRMLDMAINAFWFETCDEERGRVAVVLGGIPGAYLAENGVTELRNLHLPDGGALTMTVRSEPEATFRLTLQFHGNARMERILRFPDFYTVKADSASVRPLGDGYFRMEATGEPVDLLLR